MKILTPILYLLLGGVIFLATFALILSFFSIGIYLGAYAIANEVWFYIPFSIIFIWAGYYMSKEVIRQMRSCDKLK